MNNKSFTIEMDTFGIGDIFLCRKIHSFKNENKLTNFYKKNKGSIKVRKKNDKRQKEREERRKLKKTLDIGN